jgi:uncharacterized protein YgbK (DUF1537 family)
MPKADAVALLDDITTRLESVGTRQIFYKYCATFDSTDEGNIGPCADFLTKKYAMPQMVFCPGFPDFRIYVHEGYMFYKDRIISESIKRFDPLTPMNDPDMARVLQRQTKRKVGLLPHRVLHQGVETAKAWLDDQLQDGVEYLVMDAVDNDDILCGASLTMHWRIMTGGDAMPIALAKLRKSQVSPSTTKSDPIVHADGPGVILAGSCGQATLDQLDHFERNHPVLRVHLATIESRECSVQDALAWATPLVGSRPLAITTAASPDAVEEAQRRFGRLEAAALAEGILADLALALYKRGARRFVVSGGETSGAVVHALGIPQMRVAPFDDLGAGCCVAKEPAHVSLFLKPGKIGTPDVFERALRRLSGSV